MDKKEIKKAIEDFYQDVAQGEIKVEGDIEEINQSLGYSQEDLEAIPEEAQLGLGCGNPVINARVQTGEIIADLGSGRGMDVFLMSKIVGQEGLVIGIDNNQSMIQGAREIAKKRDYTNVDFRLGEIDDLPIEDGGLDLLTSNCAINLSRDKRRVYKEIYRVLKIGGRISLSDIVLKKELPEEIKNNPRVHGT